MHRAPRVGIMQGRLTPRPAARALQVFPADWTREFETAARLGFHFIEWLLPADDSNPLRDERGRREIRRIADATGLPVGSVCAARFLDEDLGALPETVEMAAAIGATRVLVPLLEQAHIRTPERESRALAALLPGADAAARAGVTLVLELDLPGAACARILGEMGRDAVRACYDAGNSTALGLDVGADIEPVLPRLGEVHIKDRRTFGPSVPLGRGDANFSGLFAALGRGGYAGDLVLEHFFGERPEEDASEALGFVQGHLRRAGY